MDRLNIITKDCFGALLQIRQAEPNSLPAPEQVQQRLRKFINDMMRKGSNEGLSRQDVDDIAYALVALADELAVNKSDEFREYWLANLLQFQFFKENRAGEGFFNKLQEVRKDPQRLETLRAYYLCLIFGFQGRYRVRGGELELMKLIEELQRELAHSYKFDTETLSPSGERPASNLKATKRTLPLVAISAGVVVFSLLVYGGLRLGLSSSVSSLVEEIEASSATSPTPAAKP
ncbi:type IVB secretion system protein IcmH/DotU [Hyalangium rubrum]|uniref:Type IVB secretion system protein IcmH/DotU n=1 Tax=Hyalangium rubrum TaxID=3103134 RepID=A0ABU5HDP2_9BACT|nr:type IVB secretion system protein IcmH/DotU [Hyalangium sp. s54d21]MDY7230938.1 type IVB secretion system protein IcmH/DotU [Hyalangium sp. s54d21]